MKEKKLKKFWIIIGIGVIIFFLLLILSTVLNVGDRLAKINKYVEYSFYVLSFLLVWFLFLNPIRVILFAPTLSVETVLDNPSRKNKKKKRKLAKNIMKSNMLDEVDIEKLRNSLNKNSVLNEELTRIYTKTIKKELNKIIYDSAKTVLVSTAISQSGRFDMLTVLAVNLKMIKQLVLKCGFRPSYSNLGKLSINVLGTALIAEGIENLELEDILPNTTTNMLAEIPLVKPLLSSITQGISNSLLTIRIGIVTRKYLFSDSGILTKKQIRMEAIKESIRMLPEVISSSLTVFPSKISKLFKKADKEAKAEA